jgi:chemotaxis protein MotB
MNGETEKEAGRTWIVSFADLLSLLLSFMVMIFAMSSIERGAPGGPIEPLAVARLAETVNWPGREPPAAAARLSAERARMTRALDLDYLAAVLQTTLAADRLLGGVVVERRGDRLVLTMPDLLFAPGESTLPEEVRPALDALAHVLGNLPNRIGILGYADREPVRGGGEYASDWELSLARALAVAERLDQARLGRPVVCYGLADIGYDALGEFSDSRRRSMA